MLAQKSVDSEEDGAQNKGFCAPLKCLHIFQNLAEGLYDQGAFLFCDDALLRQHPRVGYAAGDVLLIHSLIEWDGGVEFISG